MSTTTGPNSTTPPITAGPSTFSDIFMNTNLIYLAEFLAIYIVLYFILGFFFKGSDDSQNGSLRVTRILDLLVLIFVVFIIAIMLFNIDFNTIGDELLNYLTTTKAFAENPFSILSVVVFIVIFYAAIYLVRLPMSSDLKPISIMIIENLLIIGFAILFIVDFFKYILNIDLLNYTFDGVIGALTTPTPSASATPTPSKTPTATPSATTPVVKNEVFNIRNNLYTYDDAKEVCSIYGAKLATYDQIESAYNDGGEWCNYGWSENQMALFPTQKKTWNKLQESDATKNACGRPGVNGGFMKNKNIRFGVNCYGKKPEPSAVEKDLMNANVEDNIPVSEADKKLKAKIEMWKQNADKFLLINSFDRSNWSEIKTTKK
jgi:hypothetical protein